MLGGSADKDLVLPESLRFLALDLGIFFLPVSPMNPKAGLFPGRIFQTVAEYSMVNYDHHALLLHRPGQIPANFYDSSLSICFKVCVLHRLLLHTSIATTLCMLCCLHMCMSKHNACVRVWTCLLLLQALLLCALPLRARCTVLYSTTTIASAPDRASATSAASARTSANRDLHVI